MWKICSFYVQDNIPPVFIKDYRRTITLVFMYIALYFNLFASWAGNSEVVVRCCQVRDSSFWDPQQLSIQIMKDCTGKLRVTGPRADPAREFGGGQLYRGSDPNLLHLPPLPTPPPLKKSSAMQPFFILYKIKENWSTSLYLH